MAWLSLNNPGRTTHNIRPNQKYSNILNPSRRRKMEDIYLLSYAIQIFLSILLSSFLIHILSWERCRYFSSLPLGSLVYEHIYEQQHNSYFVYMETLLPYVQIIDTINSKHSSYSMTFMNILIFTQTNSNSLCPFVYIYIERWAHSHHHRYVYTILKWNTRENVLSTMPKHTFCKKCFFIS